MLVVVVFICEIMVGVFVFLGFFRCFIVDTYDIL